MGTSLRVSLTFSSLTSSRKFSTNETHSRSTQVSPVAQLPSHLPHSIPQILINRDPVSHHNFDICLLGDGDTIVKYLCERLQEAHIGEAEEDGATRKEEEVEEVEEGQDEWDLEKQVPVQVPKKMEERTKIEQPENGNGASLPPPLPVEKKENGHSVDSSTPERVSTSHVWLFDGANREAKWIEMVRQAFDENPVSGSEDDDEDGKEEVAIGEGGETTEHHLTMAADLQPGVIAGEDSDGEEGGADDDVSDDGTQVKGDVQV